MSGQGQNPDPTLAFLQLVERFGSVVEACAGYREKCKRSGFSEAASEEMAVRLHDLLITRIMGAMGKVGR